METGSFKQILAASDYSDLSANAVATAASLCRKLQSMLTLVHVVEHAVPLDDRHFQMDYTRELKQYARSQLRQMAATIREDYGVPVDELVEYGDVATEILRAARNIAPGLIVVGTHGISGFRSLFIGSTAYRLVKHTTIPVLTVPGGGDWSEFRKILFPVRLVPDALEKYDVIRPIVTAWNASLYILGLSRDTGEDRIDGVIHLGEQLIARLVADHVPYEVTYAHCHHLADRVLASAAEKKSDLVVITANLDHTLKEYFVGPYAQHVLNHARIPVLSVRS